MGDTLYELDDVLGVVAIGVGVGGDAAAFVGLDAVLVYDPLEGGAIAEPIGERLCRKAGEREKVVDDEGGVGPPSPGPFPHKEGRGEKNRCGRVGSPALILGEGFRAGGDCGGVFAGEAHFLYAEGQADGGVFLAGQRIAGGGFVVEVEVGEFAPDALEGGELFGASGRGDASLRSRPIL